MEATGLNVQQLSLDYLEHELLWYKDKTLPRYTSTVTLVLEEVQLLYMVVI